MTSRSVLGKGRFRTPRAGDRRAPWRLAGRVALWLAVGLVLARGLASLFGSDPAPAAPVAAASAPAWPDAEAESFATSFARAYLTYSPADPAAHAAGLAPFLAEGLEDDAGLELSAGGPAQRVVHALPEQALAIDADTALVTVALELDGPGAHRRHLTVPVGRDGAGALVVADYPSFAPGPARGAGLTPTRGEPLGVAEARGIEDVLERFFTPFLAGDARALEYFVPAGERLPALSERYALHELTGVTAAGPAEAGAERTVLATLRARERASGAVFTLRYRVSLERRDRWYVRSLNTV